MKKILKLIIENIVVIVITLIAVLIMQKHGVKSEANIWLILIAGIIGWDLVSIFSIINQKSDKSY